MAEHAVIGSGRAVQYQIHKLYHPPEPTRRVNPIAVNLLNVAGIVLRSVGGTGKTVVLHDQEGTAIGTVFGREIDAVRTAMDELESASGGLLLDLLDLSKTDTDFQKSLFEFSSLAINLRVSRVQAEQNWKAIWEGVSEALSGKPASEDQ